MGHRIALYNSNFKMESPEMLEDKLEEVRNRTSKFTIVAGPLILKGETFKETYVLEVHYPEADDHIKTLPLNGFDSQLYLDYVDKATELADQFCKEQGLTLNHLLNSYPEYQAVVSRKRA